MKQKLLLLLLGVLSTLPALARDFKYSYEGKTITYTVIDEDAKTCKTKEGSLYACGNSVSGDLILPANPKDGDIEYRLTTIGYHSFFEAYPTSVKIPDTVTVIDEGGFCGCWMMTSVNIPNSVKEIHSAAFSGCGVLETVNIPNSVKLIGSAAFRG